MSLLNDIFERIFFPNRDVHAIPVLDGGFSPNTRLEEAGTLADLTAPDAVCVAPDGTVYASEGARIVAFRGDDFSRREVFAEAGAAVGALGVLADGTIVAALAGRGVAAFGADGKQRVTLDTVDGVRLACVTAIAAMPDGSLVLTDGSRHNAADQWLQDLMQQRPGSGRLIACAADLSNARVVRDGLSWPSGVVAAPVAGRVLVAEAWTHRLLSIDLKDGATTIVVKNFTGYPCRIAPAASGGYWIAFFALRTQLTEFILREHGFRAKMMAKVPPELWIGPSLGGHFDYREPTQVGRIKKLGIQKPWAPPRSYGLVARVDANGFAHQSLHSRVSGLLHGVTDVKENGGRLLLVSKGSGRLASVELSAGAPA